MPASLLQIIQTMCDELGLQRPSTVAATTDVQIRQLYALANRELREIQQDKNWTALQKEFDLHVAPPVFVLGDITKNSNIITNISAFKTSDFSADASSDFGGPASLAAAIHINSFVCMGQAIVNASRVMGVGLTNVTISQPATASATQVPLTFAQDTYAGPVDFDRYINQTWWDRTNRWSLMGPDSPQMDQWHRSGIVTIGPRRHFRQIGFGGAVGGDFNNDFNIDVAIGTSYMNYRLWPPPAATDTPINIAFEYISNSPVLSAQGAPQVTFLADSDICVLDENMIIMGLKWRFYQIKGFDYAPMQQEYQDYVDRKYGNDGGSKVLSLPGLRYNALVSSGQVPDGSWPGPGPGN